MSHLFDELKIRDVTFRNRVGVSPMCQYSSVEGFATDWHLVHLGSFAKGGAGLVIMEMTDVEPIGRITAHDSGLWSDEQIGPLKRITDFIHGQDAVAGIQIAHAGRKASRARPWEGDGNLPNESGGWDVVGPSAIAFGEGYRTPRELSIDEIQNLVESFTKSARRALRAGFRVLELHAAHGYLIHSFLSPLSNQRQDRYGGSLENRMRFLLEVTEAVRGVWPENLPLFVRLSCSDWVDGGWSIEESVVLSIKLKKLGVDLMDCSSGGNVVGAKIPVGPGYQVHFAERIKKDAGILTSAVGMITDPLQAEGIIQNGKADMVLLAREMLRDPHWTFRAGKVLHEEKRMKVPPQYLRSV